MRIRHFVDTDTLWIELREASVDETREFDEDTLVDLDAEGRVCAITVEHAAQRVDMSAVRFEQETP